ncbi:MAG: putative Ig domain-containing protein, partial [Candidatus Solibacter sp.]|nr:putative Ig domain-containing protein [Candidatus Solibacter sp.]
TKSVPGTLPAGTSLSGLTVSGTPTEGGQFYPLFQFTDSSGTPITLTLTQYPYINGVAGTSTVVNFYTPQYPTVNQPWSMQLGACCAASYAWTLLSGTLPHNVTLSSAGLLSGTPDIAGTYTFLVQATQVGNAANYGTRQIVVGVTPLNQTTGYTLPYGNVNAVYGPLALAASGGTGALTWSLFSGQFLPPGLSLDGATGVISGTPSVTGQYPFIVNISDAGGHSMLGYFNLAIYPVGGAPPLQITTGASLGTLPIGEQQYQLNAAGGTGTYTWSLVSGALATGLALRTDVPSSFPTSAQAGLIGVATAPGNYSFTLSVTSGSQTISQAFTERITGLASPGVTLPDAFVGTPYTYTLPVVNNAGPVTWSAASGLPAGLTLSAAGDVSGTPDTVVQGQGVAVYTVNIPTADVLPNATLNAAYSTTVTGTGGTAPITFTLSGSLPAGVTLSSAGTISGTVTGGSGPWNFGIVATDFNHNTYTKQMSIDVIGLVPLMPQVAMWGGSYDDFTVGGSVHSRGIGVNNGGSAPYTLSATGMPAGIFLRSGSQFPGTWNPNDGQMYGAASTPGNNSVRVTATDSLGVSTSAAFNLYMSPMIVDNADRLPNGTLGVAYSKKLRVLGGTAPYTVTQVYGLLPVGLTLDTATFLVSGTPLESGGFTVAFRFTDAAGNTYQANNGFTIFDAGSSSVNINTGSNLGNIATGVAYTRTLTASGAGSITWSPVGGTF